MTPPGHIRSDGRGGLHITIGDRACWLDPTACGTLLAGGYRVPLRLDDPGPRLYGQEPEQVGHIVPSGDDGDVTPHLMITIYPDRIYVVLKREAIEVWQGKRDICAVVSA